MRASTLKKEGKVLIPKLWLAKDFFSRLKGLMGKTNLPTEEALFFPRCNSIHTFFMRIPIDVVFLGKNGSVVEVVENLKPWRFLSPRMRARHVLELRALACQKLQIQVGDLLECEGFSFEV